MSITVNEVVLLKVNIHCAEISSSQESSWCLRLDYLATGKALEVF
jgi:hypothetical protein